MLLRDPKSVAYRYPYRVQLPSFLPQQIQILYMGLSVLVIALQVVATDYLSSKEVSTSGYGVSWYKYDQRFQKSLIIFLANAQRPFVFTAGGFMNLSLPSFAGIITKSYSLIALLRQVYGR
ncbi:odorant receptor 43a-like [Teleopsis dalmanni]|uniref:odorant receptor 43a-like n=1 Tax=Teleopsis dalmanni TaxID=139649 RepID=UPI0018CEF1E3|nr:odorant receptor 43a-like [Teleopsis dalmanni]